MLNRIVAFVLAYFARLFGRGIDAAVTDLGKIVRRLDAFVATQQNLAQREVELRSASFRRQGHAEQAMSRALRIRDRVAAILD